MKEIIVDIVESLENLHDPRRVEFAKRSYPTRMRVIGVTNPNSKLVLKALKDRTKNLSARERIDLAKLLSNTQIFECQHIPLEWLGKDKNALKELTKKDVKDLMINMEKSCSRSIEQTRDRKKVLNFSCLASIL